MSDRMRALLSRAAEEQLLEQRQVSTVLGELRALLEDVDERLATGEQVERVAAEVQAVSARLDAVQARSDELAGRIADATAMVGRAAQDLVDTVAARVTEQLRGLAAGTVASVGEQVERSERRLANHVDDAVLALAEVVLRRRRPALAEPAQASAAPAPAQAADDGPAPPDDPEPEHVEAGSIEAGSMEAAAIEPEAAEPPADRPPDAPPSPGDGYVLVPADVAVTDAEPAPVVQHERRTAQRRTADRTDGSGRRQRPWWRRV